jgi:hypothetical protein
VATGTPRKAEVSAADHRRSGMVSTVESPSG